MKKIFIIIALLMPVSVAQAFMLFDVAWNDPPHSAGSVPATDLSGTTPDRPGEVQGTTVRADVAGFSEKGSVP
jgi:hypothetical protein